MLPYALDAINEAALRSLVDNQVSERSDLEYKRDLPGRGDEEVKEFLADVTSLANAQGGDLLFGMNEADGVASELVGVETGDQDAEILRLENSLRSNVAPRLIGVQSHWIPLADGRGALLMRVPGSMNAPHQVVFKNSRRFWGRSSRGKYEMDVHELRHAFTQSEQLPHKFRQLHEQAIAMARGTDMPFAVQAGPTAVITIAPLGLFREERRIAIQREHAVVPFRNDGYSGTDMIEGVLLCSAPNRETGETSSFALTHRSGRVDCAFTIGRLCDGNNGQQHRLVWPEQFEEGLLQMVNATQNRLRQFGIEGPWVVLATVIDVQGFVVMRDRFFQSAPAFRNRALLGQQVFERIEEERLRPFAENLWLLFGLQRPDRPLVANQ
ncbi:helix-turn-helix domain-containing protein [Novosphingobium sp. NDB2Meth1]|uniref:AlbA family DNA-binding domain-containing protein n=1 Tax=Novosphingobium sp. NDB2Meth1 TaxID=1892847 RepID=UPI000931692D|nr:ATP-binding protein [Novosphingobium sp. NDB2Meth1]